MVSLPEFYPSFSCATRTASAVLLLTLLAGCSGNEDEQSLTEQEPQAQAVNGGNSCLADYSDRLCDLLTEEVVRQHVADVPAELEVESRGGNSMNQCSYSWPSDRTATMKIGENEMTIDVANQVEIKWLSRLEAEDPVAEFTNKYRTMTDEEKSRAAKIMREEVDKQVAEGTVDKQAAESGTKMAEGMMSNLSFEPVEGLGAKAAWGGVGNQPSLKVLHKDTEFEVVANVTGDPGRNRGKAIEIARDLISRCD